MSTRRTGKAKLHKALPVLFPHIRFVGLDGDKKLRGQNIDFVWIDEPIDDNTNEGTTQHEP